MTTDEAATPHTGARSPVDVETTRPSEWDDAHATGPDAYSDMVATLTTSGMLTPPVPASLVGSLRALPWAWGTTREIEPFSAYLGTFEVLGQCLGEDVEDFWLYAHRGHGINSYGMGLLARVGGLFVAQQHAHGGAYMYRDTVAPINWASQSWSHLLEALPTRSSACSAGVIFSDYRGYCCVISNHRDDRDAAIVTDRADLPEGWHYLYRSDTFDPDIDREINRVRLEELRTAGRWPVRLAANHLWRLMNPGEDNNPHARARRIR